MKILMINDLAAVSYVLARFLRKAGHQADNITFMNDDEFGFNAYYGGQRFRDRQIFEYWLRGQANDYDIIHVHFSWQLLPLISSFVTKPIVMHYHGSELAQNFTEARLKDKVCKLVLVSGEQLLQYHPRAKYLPNPVDTELFTKRQSHRQDALIFAPEYLDISEVSNLYKDALVIHERGKNTIPYPQLPEYLSAFKAYVDYRKHKQRGILTDRSKTALEALACGVPVMTEKGEWLTELPEQHKPQNVVKQLLGYYEGILN